MRKNRLLESTVLGALVFGTCVAFMGCAEPPPPPEAHAESHSNISAGCALAATAVGAATDVAVSALAATGVCAEGAVAATVMSGGVAAAGSLVCIAPAVVSAFSFIAGLIAAGTAYLMCDSSQSTVAPADNAATTTPAPATVDTTSQCEGVGADNVSATDASGCPQGGETSRTDEVFCTKADDGSGDWVGPDGQMWNCAGSSPHYPCFPTDANGGNATHTHRYVIQYNFSPTKQCCFYRAVEQPPAICAADAVTM